MPCTLILTTVYDDGYKSRREIALIRSALEEWQERRRRLQAARTEHTADRAALTLTTRKWVAPGLECVETLTYTDVQGDPS